MSMFCQWGPPPETLEPREFQSFLRHETQFSEATLKRNKTVIDHLMINLYIQFRDHQWHGLYPQFPIMSGSVPENLKVVEPDEFDIMFPFRLGSNFSKWSINRRLVTNSPKYQAYSVTKHSYGEEQLSPEDQNALNHYGKNNTSEISPSQFYQHAKKIILACIKSVPVEEMDYASALLDSSDNSPAVTLKIHDLLYDRYILVDLVPALEVVTEIGELEEGWFFNRTTSHYVDKTVLMVAKAKDDSWRRSYSLEEHNWQNRCKDKLYNALKVIKTLAYKKSMTPLKNFDSYVYKNALFNFAYSRYFEINTTSSEILKDFIRYLIRCFERGTVPRYFEEDTNLLAKIDAKKIESVKYYLSSILDNL